MSKLELNDVDIFYGDFHAVQNVNMQIPAQAVTAFIGPSGCGKSTVLRTLNRMHEVIPGGRVEGQVLLDDEDLYAPGVDPVAVRRTVGMVFQRPNPFPTMSIGDNVVAGLRLNGVKDKKVLAEKMEESLRGETVDATVRVTVGVGDELASPVAMRYCRGDAAAVRTSSWKSRLLRCRASRSSVGSAAISSTSRPRPATCASVRWAAARCAARLSSSRRSSKTSSTSARVKSATKAPRRARTTTSPSSATSVGAPRARSSDRAWPSWFSTSASE